jgi:hypothetical protein
MSRPSTLVALLSGFLAVSAAHPVAAQQPPLPESELVTPTPDLLGAKELAKAKFAAVHANVRDLFRELREAARDDLLARFQEYVAGRGTRDVLLEAMTLVRDAARAADDSPAARLAAAEAYWAQAWEADTINEWKFRAARLSLSDYAQTRYLRLDAEIALIQARAEPGRACGSSVKVIDVGPLREDSTGVDPTWEKKFARDKFATTRSALPELARQRVRAAREWEQARAWEYLAGRGTLDILLQAARHVLDAELALSDKPVDRAAAWERYWTRAKVFELVNEMKYRSGRLSLADRMQTRYARLDAEIGWAEARAGQEKAGIPEGGKQASHLPADLLEVELPEAGTDEARALVKAKQAAVHADMLQLKRERLEAVRVQYQEREHEYLMERGWQEILLESGQQLRSAELAVSKMPTERAAACERHWTRAWLIENTNEQKYQAGRLSLADFAESRYFRLEAEIAWARARTELEKK